MRIPFGVAETVGRRERMEDTHVVKYHKEFGIFSAEVYDGHSGPLAAAIAAKILTPLFLGGGREQPDEEPGPIRFGAEALRDAYLATDRHITDHGAGSGAAAAGLYLRDTGFLAANAGDVRIVIGEGRDAIRLTTDHKPDLPEERARIEAQGGIVATLDVARVQGSLAMSRSLGDAFLKPFVTAEPRIAEGFFGRRDDVAIVACDGLWDVVTPEEAVAITRNSRQPQEAADRLLTVAVAKGSTDNITIVVLDLKACGSNCKEERLSVSRVLDCAI
jgi:protein phosphatase 1L